jgi:hypothetical protein
VEKVNIEERHVCKSAEFIAVDFVLFHKYTYIRPYVLPNMITQNFIQPLQTALVLHDTPRRPRVSRVIVNNEKLLPDLVAPKKR